MMMDLEELKIVKEKKELAWNYFLLSKIEKEKRVEEFWAERVTAPPWERVYTVTLEGISKKSKVWGMFVPRKETRKMLVADMLENNNFLEKGEELMKKKTPLIVYWRKRAVSLFSMQFVTDIDKWVWEGKQDDFPLPGNEWQRVVW